MAEETAIATTDVPSDELSERPQETREPSRYRIPAVDIFEQEGEGLRVVADLPGVAREGLDIQVEDKLLTINGRVQPTNGAWDHSEFELADYFRQFRLGDRVDREQISARFENGVLILDLPRAPEARPKKIKLTA